MNKRQYKKYAKKYFKKSYYDMRYAKIVKTYAKTNNIIPNHKDTHALFIIDSRKGNLKHPVSIKLLNFKGIEDVSPYEFPKFTN